MADYVLTVEINIDIEPKNNSISFPDYETELGDIIAGIQKLKEKYTCDVRFGFTANKY